MKTQIDTTTEVYVGGCSGSFAPQAQRILPPGEDESDIIMRPVSRSVFGSHTTSIAVLIGKTGVIFDNGTGVAQAAEFLKARGANAVYIFNTHYHHDHIGGMVANPFLLFGASIVKGIYGPQLGNADFASVLKTQYAEPYWPISPEKCKITLPLFSFIPGETIPILGGLKTLMLNHAGGCAAYRLKTPAGDIVIATDNELSTPEIQRQCADFFAGAKLVYIDVQYRNDEYDGKTVIGPGNTITSRRTWGHSTPQMVIQTYEQIVTAPELTLVGHHDPRRSDEDLFTFEKEMKERLRHLGTKVRFARECMLIKLKKTVVKRQRAFAVV